MNKNLNCENCNSREATSTGICQVCGGELTKQEYEQCKVLSQKYHQDLKDSIEMYLTIRCNK